MKILVTLDGWDAEDCKMATMGAEDLPVRDLMFRLMSGKINGFTVTKAVPLHKLNDPKFGLTKEES